MWNLTSPIRAWSHTPCIGRWSLNHWTAREVSCGTQVFYPWDNFGNLRMFRIIFYVYFSFGGSKGHTWYLYHLGLSYLKVTKANSNQQKQGPIDLWSPEQSWPRPAWFCQGSHLSSWIVSASLDCRTPLSLQVYFSRSSSLRSVLTEHYFFRLREFQGRLTGLPQVTYLSWATTVAKAEQGE